MEPCLDAVPSTGVEESLRRMGAAHTDPSLSSCSGALLTPQSRESDRQILQCLDGWTRLFSFVTHSCDLLQFSLVAYHSCVLLFEGHRLASVYVVASLNQAFVASAIPTSRLSALYPLLMKGSRRIMKLTDEKSHPDPRTSKFRKCVFLKFIIGESR